MTASPGRVLALARFGLACNLRSGLTRTGLALGLTLMVLGPVIAVMNGLPWGLDHDFALFGTLTMALFLLRSGLESQRELGLVDYFRHNFVSPAAHALSLLLALLAAWAVLCLTVLLAVLVISRGDAALAAWLASAYGLRALLLLGFVPLVERVATFRLPFLVPVIAYFVLTITLATMVPEERALVLMGATRRLEWRSMAPLARQVAVVLPLASLFSFLAITAGASRRGRLQNVPSGHGGAPHRS